MVTCETEAAQGGLEIVHAKTFGPTPSDVIVVFLTRGLVIVPDPETKDQFPIPAAGLFPAMVAAALTQTFWFGPAFAAVGAATPTIVICETEATQGAFA